MVVKIRFNEIEKVANLKKMVAIKISYMNTASSDVSRKKSDVFVHILLCNNFTICSSHFI